MTWPEYIALVLWLASMLLLSGAVSWLGSRTFGRTYWFIVAPGVAVHELSHWLACKLTFTKVVEVKLFGRDGGHVTHEKRGVLISAFIGTAPFFGCLLMVVALGYFLLPGGLGTAGTDGSLNSLIDIPKTVWRSFYTNGGWRSIRFYVFLYLAFVLTATMAPSGVDMKHSAIGLIIVGMLGALTIYVQSALDLSFWTGTPLLDLVGDILLRIVGFGLVSVAFSLVLLLPAYIVKKVIRG